jgi:hypothetical protein
MHRLGGPGGHRSKASRVNNRKSMRDDGPQHAGTAAHAEWLATQLNSSNVMRVDARLQQAVTKPAPRCIHPENDRHAAWLGRQLERRDAQDISDIPQPNTALPAGVSAMLRGQDLSSGTHEEWLDRQLGSTRNPHASASASAAAPAASASAPRAVGMVTTSDRNGLHDVRGGVRLVPRGVNRHDVSHGTVASLASSRSQHAHDDGGSRVPSRGSGRGIVASGQEDCAAGSALHSAWLERQLASRQRSYGSR